MSDCNNGLPFSFGGLPNGPDDYENARICVLPVSFDGTVSYRTGTRNGPRAIIDASRNMELYDEECGREISDFGIFTLNEVQPALESPEAMTLRVRDAVREISGAGKFSVMLGGEHSITVGAVMAMKEKHGNFSVLQLDAHSDLRESYWGTPYSHASAMRRTLDFAPVTQVGIRSSSKEEESQLKRNAENIFWARKIVGQRDWLGRMIAGLGEKVYITIDLDALDPSIMPAVGTPEPGGLLWYETLNILKTVCREKEIIGFDVVELLPQPENAAPDFLAAKLVSKLIGYVFSGKALPRP
ncbi:MAG: agmatinase [Nitrospinae bacterium]|nr:agmatinase [Nitrospinota bacterium]